MEEQKNVGQILAEYRNKDQELYETWRQSGSKKDLGVLINQLNPIIYKEVHRASGSLPTAALAAEAKNWTFRAIQSYDPSRGVLLSTHVTNYLPKIRRMNAKYQNAVRLPENLHYKFREYDQTVNELREQHNREPSDEEVAKELGWSKSQTVKFRNSLYADLIESASERPSEYMQFNDNAMLMEYLRSQLSSDELYILDNAKVKSSSEIANKLGVNINRYNYLKAKLITKIQGIQKNIGMH